MSLRARKIVGYWWAKGSDVYDVALLELTIQKGDFFRFVLHLKITHSSSDENTDEIYRLIYLSEKKVEEAKVIERYFIPGGGVAKNFPRIKSKRWLETGSWLAQIANGIPGASSKRVKQPISLSRPKPGRRFWSGHLRKRTWQIGKRP